MAKDSTKLMQLQLCNIGRDLSLHINSFEKLQGLYVAREVDLVKTIALLKLGFIESRVAIVAALPDLLLGAKTNRYKNVQLFKSTNHQIGFDLPHTYEISSTYQKNENNMLEIVMKHKKKYEELAGI